MKLATAILQSRLRALDLDVAAVHVRLNRMGHSVAYSTVAGWFNGSRGTRNVKHIRALCDILETDIATLSGGEAELAELPLDVAITRETRGLNDEQKKALLVMAKAMKAG